MSEQDPCVFVGGPIQFLREPDNADAVIITLQEVIAALRGGGFRVLSAHEAEDYGATTASFGPAEVTLRDYEWMLVCDVYVGIIPADEDGVPYRTDGTHVEIGWASALDKPMVLVLATELSQPYGHLVRGLIETGRATMVQLTMWDCDLLDAVLAHTQVAGAPRDVP
jgi:nucleoside 2-deoxyribosyltransferase